MELIFDHVGPCGYNTGERFDSEFLCRDKVFSQFPEMTEAMRKNGFILQIFHRPGNNRKRFIIKKISPDGPCSSSCSILTEDEIIEGDVSIKHFIEEHKLFNRPLYVKMLPIPEKD